MKRKPKKRRKPAAKPKDGFSPEETLLRMRREQRRKEMEYHGPLSFLSVYFRVLRRHILTGLLIWVPLLVTLWATYWVVNNIVFTVDDYLAWMVENVRALGERAPLLGWLTAIEYKPYVGFLMTLLIFLSTGFFARYLAGRKIISTLEKLVSMIPFISRIYNATQQIRDVFITRGGGVFEQVVLVEYPRKGVYVLAFVTSRQQGLVQEAANADLTAVFVPTTPNPTSGFLLYMPTDELKLLSIGVEDAMKMIVSGGAYLPGSPDGGDALAQLHEEE